MDTNLQNKVTALYDAVSHSISTSSCQFFLDISFLVQEKKLCMYTGLN